VPFQIRFDTVCIDRIGVNIFHEYEEIQNNWNKKPRAAIEGMRSKQDNDD